MAEFDFKEAVAKAHFDYVGPSFPSWFAKNKKLFVLPSLKNISARSLTGGKYFMTLKLSNKGNQFVLPNEPLIQLGQSKVIVETPTVGKYRKGTVKEYITTEDWQITIRGVCVAPDNLDDYPTNQVQQLLELFEINDSIEVESNKFFELFGIRNIVLKDWKLEEMAGQEGMQKYTIRAVSDQDFYAELSEKDVLRANYLNS